MSDKNVVDDRMERIDYLMQVASDTNAKALGFARQAVETAWEVGGKLNEAKALCKHGEWLPKLEEFGFKRSNAALLMRLNDRVQMCELRTFESVTDAMRSFIPSAQPETEPPETDTQADAEPPAGGDDDGGEEAKAAADTEADEAKEAGSTGGDVAVPSTKTTASAEDATYTEPTEEEKEAERQRNLKTCISLDCDEPAIHTLPDDYRPTLCPKHYAAAMRLRAKEKLPDHWVGKQSAMFWRLPKPEQREYLLLRLRELFDARALIKELKEQK